MGQYKRKLKKGVRWFYSGQYLNQKYHSKAIYLTKRECANAEREKLEELDEIARNPQQINFQILLNERLDYLKDNKSFDYYDENRRHFRKALKIFGNVDVATINKKMVFDLLQGEAKRLKKAGKTLHKANSMLRCLKALFNYGINIHELNIRNPCSGLKMFKVDIKLKYIPRNKDIEALKKKCNKDELFLFDFVDETACRIMEAIRFTWSDIGDGVITLYTRKAKNSDLTPRVIPKPKCLAAKTGKGRVFKKWTDTPRWLEVKVGELNQVRWNWHNLRHRRASIWINSGMNIYEIMHRLGHSNMSTTMKYLQLLGYSSVQN